MRRTPRDPLTSGNWARLWGNARVVVRSRCPFAAISTFFLMNTPEPPRRATAPAACRPQSARYPEPSDGGKAAFILTSHPPIPRCGSGAIRRRAAYDGTSQLPISRNPHTCVQFNVHVHVIHPTSTCMSQTRPGDGIGSGLNWELGATGTLGATLEPQEVAQYA